MQCRADGIASIAGRTRLTNCSAAETVSAAAMTEY